MHCWGMFSDRILFLHFESGSATPITIPGDAGEQSIDTNNGVWKGHHYVTIPANNGSVTMDVKCSKIYLTQTSSTNTVSYEVFAELTNISTNRMYLLTGSGITEAGSSL